MIWLVPCYGSRYILIEKVTWETGEHVLLICNLRYGSIRIHASWKDIRELRHRIQTTATLLRRYTSSYRFASTVFFNGTTSLKNYFVYSHWDVPPGKFSWCVGWFALAWWSIVQWSWLARRCSRRADIREGPRRWTHIAPKKQKSNPKEGVKKLARR